MQLKPLNHIIKLFTLSAVMATPVYADIKIEFSGLIEASISKVEGEDTQSAVDTIELGINVQINENVSGEIVLLQEDINTDDQTDFEVDTALIHLESQFGIFSAGKFTVPFTTGETNMIEDSTTLVEPVGVGVSFSGAVGIVEYSVYVLDPAFEDTADITGNSLPDESATAFGDLLGVNVNVGFTDNIAFNASYAKIDDKTGVSGALIGFMGDFGLILEATKIEDEDKTRSNIEASYSLGFGTFAASLQKDGEGVDYRTIGFNRDIFKNTNLNIQYIQMDDDGTNSDTVAAMLAFEF